MKINCDIEHDRMLQIRTFGKVESAIHLAQRGKAGSAEKVFRDLPCDHCIVNALLEITARLTRPRQVSKTTHTLLSEALGLPPTRRWGLKNWRLR